MSKLLILAFVLLLAACGSPTANPTASPVVVDGQATETAQPATTTPDDQSSPPAAAEGSIQGQLWLDDCASAGCSLGDGQRDNSEQGLSQAIVMLAEGACPATGGEQASTDGDGGFRFDDLALGRYCVTIAPSPAWGPGEWSAGADGRIEVDLNEGKSQATLEFAWAPVEQSSPVQTPPAVGSSDCQDRGAFYADVTVPDDTLMMRSQSFTKTWRLQNAGDCVWGQGYKLIFAAGEQMGALEAVDLPAANPGEIVDISIDMQAPDAGGGYLGYWLLANDQGDLFGVGAQGRDYIWVKINVEYLVAGDGSGGSGAGGSSSGTGAGSGSGTGSGGAASSSGSCPVDLNSSFENQVLALINQERLNRGLSQLSMRNKLTAAARGHSTDMACNGLQGHTGSDGSDWYGRIGAQGYAYNAAYENVYFGNPTYGANPQGAVTWWMNSQVHRDNILNADISEIGIGYSYSASATYGYFTTVFARP